MDHSRDINELLTNGYFRTARGRSPAKPEQSSATTASVPSFLQAHPESSYARSRSRGPRKPPPPKPIVEDEEVSLAKEQHGFRPSYEPPMRGIIEQNPIILEANISKDEAARLHELPPRKDDGGNAERRFVFVPRSEANSKNSSEDEPRRKDQGKRDSGKGFEQEIPVREKKEIPPLREVPPMDRRTSRQDLPSLETQVPKELPPQFRRSNSSYSSSSKLESPKPSKTPEYFLSPDVMRGPKDSFKPSQSAPRYSTTDFGGRASGQNEKRNSGSFPSTRPDTPSSDKRHSGNFESGRRSRKNSMEKVEKLTRPQQLSEEFNGKRPERPPAPERKSTNQSSRSSSRRYYSSSDEDLTDSDSDRRRRRKHQSSNLHPGDSRHQRSSSKSSSVHRPVKSGSRHTSPLPSPKNSQSYFPPTDNIERSGTFPLMKKVGGSRPGSASGHRDQKLNPFEFPPSSRPGSRHSSQGSFPIPIPMPMPPNPMEADGGFPIPNPSRVEMPSVDHIRRTSTLPKDDDRSSTVRPTEKPAWQPPKFEPPAQLEKPVGSYRRYSEDIERGSAAPLASCSRKNYVRGRNDWLTLPQCPGFDICPSCYNSTMAPTEFRHMFIPSPFRSPDTEVLCDFGSSPWFRIAWLLTLKDRRRDLNLFYGLAKVINTVEPCHGSHEVMRQWYSIIDPKTGSPIRNFDVCYSCVKSIEVLLPSIRGIFVRGADVHTTSSAPRICDLRFDSKRFVNYFDALETTADEAEYSTLPPDTRSLASLVRRLALIDECQKDADLRDARWHIITQLPEFTVCPDCFEEVVWPELSSSRNQKAIPLMFNKTVQWLPKASCQLYSERMRAIFKSAVESDDYKYLAGKARERRKVEGGYKVEVAELKRALMGNPGSRRIEGDIEKVTGEWRLWE